MAVNYLLIGHPLGHSMSPFIHERLFKASGISEDYILKDIAPEDLENSFDELAKLKGFNITIPHKMGIIPFCDKLDDSAKRYNSVNCVSIKDGVKTGYNTDCDGFLMSVKDEYPLDGNVLLVGCGGVGRMIGIEAARHGASLTIAYIPQDAELVKKAVEEISKFTDKEIKTVLTTEISGKFDMMINATPVGMYPKTDACPVSDEVIEKCKTFFDVIYNPTDTKLIKTAKSQGKLAKGGAFMLVLQAVRAHEIWYGAKFSKETINSIVKDMQDYVDNNFSK